MSDLTKKDNVMVFVRVRPLNSRELKLGQGEGWICDERSIRQGDISKSAGRKPEHYTFDHVFLQGIDNKQIFNDIGLPIVDAVLGGYNGIIFAYGQTSSGKTHTIQGYDADPGLIPRCVESLFQKIESTPDRDFAMSISYLECYNEIINDLLEPSNSNLKIREDPKKGVFVQGLSEAQVGSQEHVEMLLEKGQSNRQVGRTDFNAVSSRSHTIFTIRIESQSTNASDKKVLSAVLNMVDLAGSENLANTTATKSRKTETGHINKSLLVLGHVISMIAQGKDGGHIPFRDSKLTRMLKDSLNGKAVVSICCNMSPGSGSMDITSSTLRFADRAKQIKNTATQNVKAASKDTMIAKYKEEIELLKAQLAGGGGDAPDAVTASVVDELKQQHEKELNELKQKLLWNQTLLLGKDNEPDAALAEGQGIDKSVSAADRRTSLLQMTKGMSPRAQMRLTNDSGQYATPSIPDFLEVKANADNKALAEELQEKHADNQALHQELEDMRTELEAAQNDAQLLNTRIEENTEDYEDKVEEIESLMFFIENLKEKLKAKDTELDEAKDKIFELESSMADYEKADAEEAAEQDEDGESEQPAPQPAAVSEDRTPPATVSLTISIKDLLPRFDGEACNPTVGLFMADEDTPDDFEFVARTNVANEAVEATFDKSIKIKNKPGNLVRMSLYDMFDAQDHALIATFDTTVGEILSSIESAGGGVFYDGDQPTVEQEMILDDEFQFLGNKKFPVSLGISLRTKAMRKKMKQKKKEKSKRMALKKENKQLRDQIAALQAQLA